MKTPVDTVKGTKIYTIYAHLDSATVLNSNGVKAGQQIGISDNTGRSTGPHLHFEVIYTTKKITQDTGGLNDAPRTDPMIFLNSRFIRNNKKLPSQS